MKRKTSLGGVELKGRNSDVEKNSVDKINADNVIGFVGGVDSPVINDFLYGYIEGAQSVNPDVKVCTRYTNTYVDTAIAKEHALSMINDYNCDIIWGVAGNSGNGAAEAALETGKAWFIGVDSDQELTFSPEVNQNILYLAKDAALVVR